MRSPGLDFQASSGQAAVDEVGPVLDLELALDDPDQAVQVSGGEVGDGPLEQRPDALSRFVIVLGSLDRRLSARRLSARKACSGWWSGPGSCERATVREAGRRRRCGHGHLPQMVAVTSVPDGELWRSFPEAVRSDIVGLLGMLLERWAVSAGLAAEGTGGEHGAAG
jgi:hypothetical protein